MERWGKISNAAAAVALMISMIGGVSAQTVEYIHTDALGTPIAVTDVNRNVIERSEYAPYGELLNRPATDGPGYTGHVQDVATGLVYMQQRYYDPQLGIFDSVDPVTAYEKPVTNFCRYCYARNNPYKFTDPDGRDGATFYTDPQLKMQVEWDQDQVDAAITAGSIAYGGIGTGALRSLGSMIFRRLAPEAGVSLAQANKIHHIFSQARHNLGGLAKTMGGEAKAFKAIENATVKAVDASKAGKFENVVKVGGQQVTVRGNVVNGEVKVGTAFIKPPPPPLPKITP